jgi:hypothetical protein
MARAGGARSDHGQGQLANPPGDGPTRAEALWWRLSDPAQEMGGRTQLGLDHPLASPRPRS